MPWLAVHGNHDRLIQGTVPGEGPLGLAAVGDRKPVALPSDWSTEQVLGPDGRPGRVRPAGAAGADGGADPRGHRRPGSPAGQPRGVRAGPPARRARARPATASRPAPRRTTGTTTARCGSSRWTRSTGTAAGRARWTGPSWPGWMPSWRRPTPRGGTSSCSATTRWRPWSTGWAVTACSAPSCWRCSPRTRASCCGWPGTRTRRGSPPTAASGRSWRRPSSTGPSRAGSSRSPARGGTLEIAATMLDHAGTVPWDGTTASVEASGRPVPGGGRERLAVAPLRVPPAGGHAPRPQRAAVPARPVRASARAVRAGRPP